MLKSRESDAISRSEQRWGAFLNHCTIAAATFCLSSSQRTCRRQIVEDEQCLHKQRLSRHFCQDAEVWYPAWSATCWSWIGKSLLLLYYFYFCGTSVLSEIELHRDICVFWVRPGWWQHICCLIKCFPVFLSKGFIFKKNSLKIVQEPISA